MKTKDIHIGKSYTNGKGNVREVIDIVSYGAALYGPDTRPRWVRFMVIAKTGGPYRFGDVSDCTIKTFAKWAKKEV